MGLGESRVALAGAFSVWGGSQGKGGTEWGNSQVTLRRWGCYPGAQRRGLIKKELPGSVGPCRSQK